MGKPRPAASERAAHTHLHSKLRVQYSTVKNKSGTPLAGWSSDLTSSDVTGVTNSSYAPVAVPRGVYKGVPRGVHASSTSPAWSEPAWARSSLDTVAPESEKQKSRLPPAVLVDVGDLALPAILPRSKTAVGGASWGMARLDVANGCRGESSPIELSNSEMPIFLPTTTPHPSSLTLIESSLNPAPVLTPAPTLRSMPDLLLDMRLRLATASAWVCLGGKLDLRTRQILGHPAAQCILRAGVLVKADPVARAFTQLDGTPRAEDFHGIVVDRGEDL
eukprot:scaffold99151_cov66-Phaeocystis_antarctica.AAC.2